MLPHPFEPLVVGDGIDVAGHEMAEHQELRLGNRGDAADVLGRRVRREQMFPECRAIRHPLHDAVDAGHIQRLMHQHVAALGEFAELRIVLGVAGEHDRSVRGLELVGEIVHDRRMRSAERGDGDVVGLQHHAVGIDVLGDQQLAQVGPAFVGDARLDVELVHLPIGFRHRFGALGTERMDRRFQPGRPGVIGEVAVFEIVIRVQVAEQDVFDRVQRDFRGGELMTDTHAAIEHDRRVVHHNQIGRI